MTYPAFFRVFSEWEISQYGLSEFYAYRYCTDNAIPQLIHIKDEVGRDKTFQSHEEALAAILQEQEA